MRIVERATRRRYTPGSRVQKICEEPSDTKCRPAVFSRGDAETQREVLDRINRIDRIDGSGDSNALQSNLDTPTHENPAPSSFTVAQTRRQCLGERRKQGKRSLQA